MVRSVWEEDSVDFMCQYTKTTKIPSALLIDYDLGLYARKKNDFHALNWYEYGEKYRKCSSLV